MTVEAARKHGPFDSRWARGSGTTSQRRTRAPVTAAKAPGGLDWSAFAAQYFPRSARHDLEAISSYVSYKRASG
jgi:hypothetical protein